MSIPIPLTLLPIRTDRTLRAVPYVTYSLCFLNLFVFLHELGLSAADRYQYTSQWGFSLAHPSLVTLFTHAFLHADIFHIAGNLLLLWLVGTVLETGIGSILFLLLYFASLVSSLLLYGSITQAVSPGASEIHLVGASGAIAGVTGFAAFRYYRMRTLTVVLFLIVPVYWNWFPLWWYAVYFAAIETFLGIQQVIGGEGDYVAHWAHIGGLGLGVLTAVLMKMFKEGKREFVLEDVAKATTGARLEDRSLQELEQLLRERPDDPELLEAVAALWVVNGNLAQSREIYLRAIPLFIAAGQPDRAAIDYLNVLHAFPDEVLEPRTQMKLASTLEGQGHFTEAVQAFTLVVKHAPQHDDAQTALLRAAQIYQRHLGDMTTAGQYLQALLQRYPTSPFRRLAQERLQVIGRYLPIAQLPPLTGVFGDE